MHDQLATPESATPDAPVAPPEARPTSVRYGVLAFSVSMAVILYLDRMAMNVAIPTMAEDLNLPLEQVADGMGMFFWIYALCQIPAGWLGDRLGGRRMLTACMVAWSLATAGMGFISGLWTLILFRSLLGVGQAGAYATTASFLRRWMPFASRGLANSSVSLGGRAGGVLAPALTSIAMTVVLWSGLAVDRWRPVFVVYGALGLVWAWGYWRWFRDLPQQHPRVNSAECALIAGPGESDALTENTTPVLALPRVGLGEFLGNRSLWALIVVNFSINVGWIFAGALLSSYLIKVHGQSDVQAGIAASLVAFAGMAGCLAGGLMGDWMARRLNLAWARRVPCMISYGGAALAYAGCYFVEDPRALVAVLVVASFLGDIGLGPLWCAYQDIGGPYAGTVLGVGNMWGNFGAAVASSLIPRLALEFGWSSSFVLSAVMYSIGALGWLLIDPRVPIVSKTPVRVS